MDEAAPESLLTVEVKDVAGEGAGAVAAGAQRFGDGGIALVERPQLGPMLIGVAPGNQRRVRWERPRRSCEGIFEQRTLLRQTVEMRTGAARIPVSGEVIGTQCVDDEYQDIRGAGRCGGKLRGRGAFAQPLPRFDSGTHENGQRDEDGQRPLPGAQRHFFVAAEPASCHGSKPDSENDEGVVVKMPADCQESVGAQSGEDRRHTRSGEEAR
jgi:hypothetical protein